jgi:hypothetical protein
MGRRLKAISKSIIRAICSDATADKKTRLARIFALFSLLKIVLARFKWELWRSLRDDVWEVDEREYTESFRTAAPNGDLTPIGDLGYSGSVRHPSRVLGILTDAM